MGTEGADGSSQQATPDGQATGAPAASNTPDPASAPGPPGGATDPASKATTGKPRRRKLKLRKWQATIVAVIGGTATIVAAIITIHGGPPAPAPTATSSSSPGTAGAAPGASISRLTYVSVPPPPTQQWTFYGSVTDAPVTSRYEIYVITPNPSRTAVRAQQWLVSPPAQLSADGSWQVHWKLSLAVSGSFKPVIIYGALAIGVIVRPRLPPDDIIAADLARYGAAAAKGEDFRIGTGNSVPRHDAKAAG